jgi:N-methylhydantoinase B
MENTVVAPYGVAGGGAGRTGHVTLNPGTPEEQRLPALGDGIVVKRGDVLRFETCGGGGWGDPLTRDPIRVWEDVARGFITPRGALEDYGVVLDAETGEPDKTATEEERRRRMGTVQLIDRGPGFDEAEARWRAARAAE